MTVVVYSDGSVEPNPGPGGWGAVLIFEHHEVELCGGEGHTTNNRMEMQAAIEALEAIGYPAQVVLHSDSQYLTRGMSEWLPRWLKQGLPEKNRDLWERLASLAEYHAVEWIWVRGHSGVEGNERADLLATKGRLGS